MAILFLDFFGSDPSKMDQTRKFGEQTSGILEFKPNHFRKQSSSSSFLLTYLLTGPNWLGVFSRLYIHKYMKNQFSCTGDPLIS